MTDQELRAMVRDAIARASARPSTGSGRAVSDSLTLSSSKGEPDPERDFRANVAFAVLPLTRGGDGDGPCLIEPGVRCTHCGFCVSFGH